MSIDTPAVLSKTLFVGDDDVAAVADWDSIIGAIREAYTRGVSHSAVPARAIATTSGGWMRTMSAAPIGGLTAGTKIISASTEAGVASYLIALFDQNSSELVAIIDGNRVTGLRTAATSVVAIDSLAPQRPLQVGFLGSGFEAQAHFEALASVRAISSARVYSPTLANRERFAATMESRHGVPVVAVGSAQGAVDGADVVICAARSRDESPTIFGSWLSPGTVVVSIGSTVPSQRETDTEVIRRAALIIADSPEEVAGDTGDMIAARAEGIDVEGKLISLSDWLQSDRKVHPEDILLYKSTGSALQDIVAAEILFNRALDAGRGTSLPTGIRINNK